MRTFGWLWLVGCAADADQDGLLDRDEAELGTDPVAPDTDGDGLLDGAEAGYGADPLVPDTDGDGYLDRDEVHEGHDPADPEDGIYIGGWPYVFDKGSLAGDAGNYRAIGAPFYRLRLVDQFGETVDLYDYANADKPIVIDISAEWCPPCNALSSYIAGEEDWAGYSTLWARGPKAVKRGDVYWITLMPEDIDNLPAGPEVATRWADAYPSEQVPVLSDPTYLGPDYAGLAYWPYVLLLEPDLTVSQANRADFGSAVTVLEELQRRFP